MSLIDPDSIASRYTGESRLQRLLFIAPQNPYARTLASQYARQQQHLTHKDLYASLDEYHAADVSYRQKREVLSARLTTAQSHLNKDAIRVAYLELAQLDQAAGHLTDALHSALRAKDYCTSRWHTTTVSLAIIELALLLKHYSTVREYVHKVEHTVLHQRTTTTNNNNNSNNEHSSSEEALSVVRQKLAIASGLERLSATDWNAAAQKFSLAAQQQVSATDYNWSNILAPEEIALYAAVLSLAVASRTDMMLLAHSEVTLAPLWRDALLMFAARAAYQQVWNVWQEQGPVTLQDLYLSAHWPALTQILREKCIVEYWKPFQRVSLRTMAEELGTITTVEQLPAHMAELISKGQVQHTRIDKIDGVLIREEPRDAMEHTRSKLTKSMDVFVKDSYAMVIRLSCTEHDVTAVTDQRAESDNEAKLDTPMVDMNPEDLY